MKKKLAFVLGAAGSIGGIGGLLLLLGSGFRYAEGLNLDLVEVSDGKIISLTHALAFVESDSAWAVVYPDTTLELTGNESDVLTTVLGLIMQELPE